MNTSINDSQTSGSLAPRVDFAYNGRSEYVNAIPEWKVEFQAKAHSGARQIY